MDLTSSIVNLQSASLASKIDFAVARKVLDNEQAQGDAAIQLINAAVGGVSKAGDALVAAATGLGGRVDTYA